MYDYIRERNPFAAKRVVARIQAAAARIRNFPYSGRLGVASGTRERIVRGLPYVLVYEVHPDDNEIVVIAVFHGAQDRSGEPASRE